MINPKNSSEAELTWRIKGFLFLYFSALQYGLVKDFITIHGPHLIHGVQTH